MKVAALFLLAVAVSHVSGTTQRTFTYRTSASGAACGASVTCDGGLHRTFTAGSSPTNVIPQEPNVLLEYDGGLAEDMWFSLVDNSLNGGNPCAVGAIAAAGVDNLHSGVIKAAGQVNPANGNQVGSGRLLKIPQLTSPAADATQTSNHVLLDATKTYTACYSTDSDSDGDADAADTWNDAGVLIKISKIHFVTSYGVNHRTSGTIPNHNNLVMRYTGTLLNDRWISFVDATLGSGDPCVSGLIAAAPADSLHSGSILSDTNVLRVNTEDLSGTATFAVCYAESGGITSSVWKDSSIRLKRSRITAIATGVDTMRLGQGSRREIYNVNPDDSRPLATSVIPRTPDYKIEYIGDLPNDKKISLVDDSLMDPDTTGSGYGLQVVGNPCAYAAVAAQAPDIDEGGTGAATNKVLESGPLAATKLDGSAGGKIVTVPQGNNELLDPSKTYAVCYSEGDGTTADVTWADSYIRVTVSKLMGIKHHAAIHNTDGHLPSSGDGTVSLTLELISSFNTAPQGATFNPANLQFAFVHESISGSAVQSSPVGVSNTGVASTFGINANFACQNGLATTAADSSGLQSGAISATVCTDATVEGCNAADNSLNELKGIVVDSSKLHTGSISGNALTETYFALCYTEGGSSWVDSGIRVTVSKIQHMLHGTAADGPYDERIMAPISAIMDHNNGLADPLNVLPQATGQSITYVSNIAGSGGALTSDTQLGSVATQSTYVSLVEASLNANKPCAVSTVAGAAADAQHSGMLTIAAGSKTATVPQTTLLDGSKIFALCYAITTGSTADATWADSYVRVTISKVQKISSRGVDHSVSSYVATIASREKTGTHETNNDGAVFTQANLLDITYSGSLAGGAKAVLIDDSLGTTTTKDSTHRFTAGVTHFPCGRLSYNLPASNAAEVAGGSSYSAYGAVDVDDATSYSNGLTTQGVDVSTTNGFTTLFETGHLDATKIYAYCYSEDGGTTWHESGIRVRRSEVKSLTTASQHTGTAARVATSVFFATNVIPQHSVDMTFAGELGTGEHMSMVDVSLTGDTNPCVRNDYGDGTATAVSATTHSGDLTATGKVITIAQSSGFLDQTKTFAACYRGSSASVAHGSHRLITGSQTTIQTDWHDSYIRFTVSAIRAISHKPGSWSSVAGSLVSHYTFGQLPHQYSPSLTHAKMGIDYSGNLANEKYISFVADDMWAPAVADADQTYTTTHAIKYTNPCTNAANAAATMDTLHSGVLQADSGSTTVSELDSTDLDTSRTYALCYTAGTNGDATDTWYESGIRVTFPKVINVQLSSGFTGINARDMTSTFYPTNVIPMANTLSMAYRGDIADGAQVVLMATTSSNNPCVDQATVNGAAGKAFTTSTRALNMDATGLSEGVVYAVCYSATSGTTFYDSYIRLTASLVGSLTVNGITTTTTGGIPNVGASDTFTFTYGPATSTAGLELAFVDETQNSYEPCGINLATAVTGTGSLMLSTVAQSTTTTNSRVVNSFETHNLDTTKTYALCYVNSGTAHDSGIRVTPTKIWNMLYDSGVDGPACSLPAQGPVNTQCKYDVKPRDITSVPHPTNVIPQATGIVLEYRGSLANSQYISLVDASLNSGNPCASGAVAGAAASTQHSGPILATNDGSLGGNQIVIPQSTLLDATKTFAVCYDDASSLPPFTYSTVLFNYDATGASYDSSGATTFHTTTNSDGTATVGKATSATWRDSFIRIGISKLKSLDVMVSQMPLTNTFLPTTILTQGQVPSQAKDQQMYYKYSGSLAATSFLTVVPSATNGATSGTDTATGTSVYAPCTGTASNPIQAATSQVTSLTSLTGGTTGLDASVLYALCYSEDGTNWHESGLRITVPKVTAIKYIDETFKVPTLNAAAVAAPTTRDMYTRTLESITKSTSILPQQTSLKITYEGTLADDKYLSMVVATENSGYPCADPTVAATVSPTTTRSGVGDDHADANTVTFFPTTTGDFGGAAFTGKGSIIAVCYAEGDLSQNGNTLDRTWRDSYIRLTLSKVESITAYKVNHNVMGMIPNHATLKFNYYGTLPADKHFMLADTAMASTSFTGGASWSFPCANAATVMAGTDSQHEQATSVTGSVVQIDTTKLSSGTTMAVCYSAGGATSSDVWVDSGIRVLTPDVYNLQADSGYNAAFDTTVDGTPVRDQRSSDQTDGSTVIDRPTNRHPQVAGVELLYVTHSTVTGSDIPTTNSLDNWYISLVDASLNSNDPCTVGANPKASTAGASNLLTGSVQAAGIGGTGNGKIAAIPMGTLLDTTKTFAVCYSYANSGDTAFGSYRSGDSSFPRPTTYNWFDTYVRLGISEVQTLVTGGVVHRTFGQVPNTPSSDAMVWTVTGPMASGHISLVDATFNPTANGVGNPCVLGFAEKAASTGYTQYSGAQACTNSATAACTTNSFDTQRLSTAKVFALCYTKNSDASQNEWKDSGIRVTVPRVWNMKYASGVSGPACPMVNPDGSCEGTSCTDFTHGQNSKLNPDCKLDTKDRDMTSKRLSTNVLPATANNVLDYVGTMGANQYISIVSASLNGDNPCVKGSVAAATADTTHSGPAQGAGTSGYEVTILQAAGSELSSATALYAVCYDDGFDVTSTAYAGAQYTSTMYGTAPALNAATHTYSTSGKGGTSSVTWRDTYVRLTVSDIAALNVHLTKMPFVAGQFHITSILTQGQVPSHANNAQVYYSMTTKPGLSAATYIALVANDLGAETDADTGISSNQPCSFNNGAGAHTAITADSTHSGVVTASSTIFRVDTKTLLTSKNFAFCYSMDGSTAWKDTGIRTTTPKLTTVFYKGLNEDTVSYRTRPMDSLVTSLSKLPAYGGQSLSYCDTVNSQASCDLAANKYVSMVDASLNSNHPCVDPLDAAAAADTTHSGVPVTTGTKFTFAQSTTLDPSKTYTLCYAEGDTNGNGDTDDLTWRDSYVHLTMTEIETIIAQGVTHRNVGQIADHPKLPITYVGGSGTTGLDIVLVQAAGGLNQVTIDQAAYDFPCKSRAVVDAGSDTDTDTTATVSAATGTRLVNVKTSNLNRQLSNGAQAFYAMCYGDASGTAEFTDTGIRLSVADVYELHYSNSDQYAVASHYTAGDARNHRTKDDVMPRHMSSEMLATNTVPLASALELTYIYHSTATLVERDTANPSAGVVTGKWLSLVATTVNSGDPCVLKATAGGAAGATTTGPFAFNPSGSASINTEVDTTMLDTTKTFAVCYSFVSGSATDVTWADSYIRLKPTALETISVLGQSFTTVGQLPNTAAQLGKQNQPSTNANAGVLIEYSGTLNDGAYITLVDATKNNHFPCSVTGGGYQIPALSGTASGIHQAGASDSKVASLDTSGLDTDLDPRQTTNDWRYAGDATAYTWGATTLGAFAVCYNPSSGAATDLAWTDSGIRVTITELHTVTYTSGYTDSLDTYTRYMTSHPSATNRLPRQAGITWTYHGDLATGKYVSIVKADSTNGFPCLSATVSGTAAGGINARTSTGGLQATGSAVSIPQANNELLDTNVEYAVCYATGDGSPTDYSWRDSYIRVKTSEMYTYANRVTSNSAYSISHRTYGQIPKHAANMPYFISGASTGLYVSLVPETLGSYTRSYLGSTIDNPCECSATGTACSTAAKHTSGTGSIQENAGQILGHNTVALDSSLVYAVCYSSDDATFSDSGIRLTVPKVSGIKYSGKSETEAALYNYPARLMQSVWADLQPSNQITANVLPSEGGQFAYVGDLAVSKHISLVAVKNAINAYNPCVEPAEAAAAPDTTHGGRAQACHSYANLCPGSTNGDKQVTFGDLSAGETYAVCYAEGDGTTTDSTWRDSYIRVSVSEVTYVKQELHSNEIYDHGSVSDHETNVKLALGLYGDLATEAWISLVDETLGTGTKKQNPCTDGAIAAATADGQHSGAYATSSQEAAIETDGLSTGVQFAICYATDAGTALGTWVDSGLRVMKTKIHTLRYNNAQLPAGSTTNTASQFLRDHRSARVMVGGDGYGYGDTSRYNGASDVPYLVKHRLPSSVASGNLQLQYFGDLGTLATTHSYGLGFALADASANDNNPCQKASVAVTSGSQSTGYAAISSSTKQFQFTSAKMAALAITAGGTAKSYALCYAEAPTTVTSVSGLTTYLGADQTYSGMGKLPVGWRDSFIRFEISPIESVKSHLIDHYTQGHLANNAALGLTTVGTLASGSWIWLRDETEGSNAPCSGTNPTTSSATVTVPAQTSTSKQASVDTTGLDTTANFAVCFAEDSSGSAGSARDSGIRVTISKITKLTYNFEQPGTASTSEYLREMDSSNTCTGCTDAVPKAINRFPQGDPTDLSQGPQSDPYKFNYIYYGNLVNNGVTPGESIPTGATISMVTVVKDDGSTGQNGGNPCANMAIAAGAATSVGGTDTRENSGALNDATSTRTVTVTPTSGERFAEGLVAVCYATGAGDNADVTWRDSYIRMRVSKLDSIISYGIYHRTDGVIAAKPALRLLSVGSLSATGIVSLVDASLNSEQPCAASFAGKVPTTSEADSYSGISTSNAGSKHTLKTDALSSQKTFALCYTEGDGSVTDTDWEDSGLRLQPPKVTSLTYSRPARTLEAKTCFNTIDLYGAANCKGGAVTGQGNTIDTSTGSDAYRNSQLPRSENVQVEYGGTHATTDMYISLVHQTRGNQANNPCRDAAEAAAVADYNGAGASHANADKRAHSGALQAGTGTKVVNIPQTLGANTGSSAGAGLLLDDALTYAVCYNDATNVNTNWRDSYIRVTMSKIKELDSSDMVVTTDGTLANVPSLKVSWVGSLATNKWITIVDVTENSNVPCDKAYAGAASFRQVYTATQEASTSTTTNLRSMNLQSGLGSKMVDMDTSKLNSNSQFYAVCYAEGDGSTGDTTWRDSGLRLRFVRWVNWDKNRLVSGAATLLQFRINQGAFQTNADQVALVKGATDCTAAPTAPWLSDGQSVRQYVNVDGNGLAEFHMPSGTGVTRVTATGWHTCSSTGGLHLGPREGASMDRGASPANVCPAGSSSVNAFNCLEAVKYLLQNVTLFPNVTNTSSQFYGSSSGVTWGVGGRTTLIQGTFSDRPAGCTVHDLDNMGVDFAAVYNDASDASLVDTEVNVDNSYTTVCQQDGAGYCEATGKFQDLNLEQGGYAICFCDGDHGDGLCDHANEWIKVTGSGVVDATNTASGTVPLEPAVKVIQAPRLGRVENYILSHTTNIRAVEQTAHTYSIKGSAVEGYSVLDNDKIYFKESTVGCWSGPESSDGPTGTDDIALTHFDYGYAGDSASSTYFSARVTLPTTLTGPRTMVACYATEEGDHNRDYVQLADGLEVIDKPRLGPIASPGHLRMLHLSTPTFNVNSLKHGDWVYLKQHSTPATYAEEDCSLGTNDAHGLITSAIPASTVGNSETASETALIAGNPAQFMYDGSGKITIPAGIENKGSNLPKFFAVCFVPAGALVYHHQGTNCPVDSPYVAVGGGTNDNGGTCMTTPANNGPTLTNVVTLVDHVQVFTPPIDALVTSWFQNHVYELKFTQPQIGIWNTKTFSSGTEGDIVVLKKIGTVPGIGQTGGTSGYNDVYQAPDCTGVHEISPDSYTLGTTHSAKMVLAEYGDNADAKDLDNSLTISDQERSDSDEKGGAAMVTSIAMGKVNELPTGIYSICYATKEAEGDDQSDFLALSSTFEILPDTATRPSVSTPRSLLMGTDIVVSWESTVNLQTRVQEQNSWIGLYRKGECLGDYGKHGAEWNAAQNKVYANQLESTQVFTGQKYTDANHAEWDGTVKETAAFLAAGGASQHWTRLSAQTGPDSTYQNSYVESNQHECYLASQFIESGVQSGVVRFSLADYKTGGEFDVRFFQGSSRNMQGRICRGMTGLSGETYVNCVLDAALVSDTIEVFVDKAKLDHIDNIPGMEVVFDNQRARFQKGSRANKLS